jgi:hypothetical protein
MAGYSGISYVSKDRASKADRSIEVFLLVWEVRCRVRITLLSAVRRVTRGCRIDMSRWHSPTAGGLWAGKGARSASPFALNVIGYHA